MAKLSLVCAIAIVYGATVAAQTRAADRPLTDQDRAEIQRLVERYALALSSCQSAEYASLFVPDGTFTSNDFRGPRHRAMYGPNGGTLVGRARLAELVETEEFCIDKSTNQGARGNRIPPRVQLTESSDGVRGTIPLANNGRYEDVYVKTSEGWRFKSRKVVMPTLPASPGSSR